MKILFYSTPYNERLFFELINDNAKGNQIIIAEGHHIGEQNDYKNIRFIDLNSAVSEADIIVTYTSQTDLEDISKIINVGDSMRIINEVEKENNNTHLIEFIESIPYESTCRKPVIILMGLGYSSQIERVEYYLCELMRDNDISYDLFSTTNTENIRETMCKLSKMDCGELRKKYSSLSIISLNIEINDVIENNAVGSNIYNLFRLVKPDYLILCCENNFVGQEEIKNLFRYKYNKSVDNIVISEYITYRSKESAQSHIFVEKKVINLPFEDITNKLAFPLGISLIL